MIDVRQHLFRWCMNGTVVMSPCTMPILSFSAWRAVRDSWSHEAFEITVWLAFSVFWFTPKTIVASTSLPPGAEMITLRAALQMRAGFFLGREKSRALEHHVDAERAHEARRGCAGRAPDAIAVDDHRVPSTSTVPGNLP